MNAAGLALGWGARISPVRSTQEKRVERIGEPASGPGGVSGTSTVAATEDAELAAACLRGDLSAYERLYALYGARMKSLARNLLGNRSDAEDAVQETFLKIQRGIAGFRGQSAFASWIFRILINACYDLRRSRTRRREDAAAPFDSGDLPAEPRGPGAHPALRIALERSLAKLPERQREILLLFEVEGFAHAEIAGILQITEAASKNSLFQAKKSLRQMLEPPRAATRPD
jgi:RNA polymerase sigma-70 factor (ECF subfamily)